MNICFILFRWFTTHTTGYYNPITRIAHIWSIIFSYYFFTLIICKFFQIDLLISVAPRQKNGFAACIPLSKHADRAFKGINRIVMSACWKLDHLLNEQWVHNMPIAPEPYDR